MYRVKRTTRKFDTDLPEDLSEYNEITQNPLCVIVREKWEKLTTTYFDEESGRMTHKSDRLIMIVSWEEREIF